MLIRRQEFHFSEDQKAKLVGLFAKLPDVKQIERLSRLTEKVICPNYFLIKHLVERGVKNIQAAGKASSVLDTLREFKSKDKLYGGDGISDAEYENAISSSIEAIAKRHGYILSRIEAIKSKGAIVLGRRPGRPVIDTGAREYIIDWGIHAFRRCIKYDLYGDNKCGEFIEFLLGTVGEAINAGSGRDYVRSRGKSFSVKRPLEYFLRGVASKKKLGWE